MGDLIRVTVIATGFPTEEGEEQTSRPRNSKVTETQPHQIPSRPVFNDTKRIEVKKTIEEPDILLTRMGETSNSDRLSSEIIENEVEAQINGAIEISERVDKEVSDDLDVPAFLRSSVKDLSLS